MAVITLGSEQLESRKSPAYAARSGVSGAGSSDVISLGFKLPFLLSFASSALSSAPTSNPNEVQ